jgi:hypothetical protein
MGYTHFDKVSGVNGIGVGASGSEVEVANSSGQLRQSGTAVSASAAQINATAVTTAGTVEANKAVVVGANKNIDTIVIADSGLKLGSDAGTAVTATAAQINRTAVTTPGTVEANKVLVVGANKNIDTIVIADGGLKLGSDTGTAVTATAAELNLLDTAEAGKAVASKALVLGANKNVDTLIIADGGLRLGDGTGTAVTPTASEINLLVQGVAAGYKIARGTITAAAATPTMTVETGLTTVISAVASLKDAPTLTHMFVVADVGDQSGAPAAGSIYIKNYRPTSSSDCTPVDASYPYNALDWIVIGT